MAPKRRLSVAAGNGLAAPPEKRPWADGGIPKPAVPLSPGRRLKQTMLVVLFLIRAKDRNMDFSLAQIGRVVREQIRHCLGPIVSKLESMDGRICALTQKVDNITSDSRNGHNHERHNKQDYIEKLIPALSSKLDNITGPSPNHHNHERLMQSTNEEGTNNAEAQGPAETVTEGKEKTIRLRFLSTEMKPLVYHDEEIESIRIGIFDGDTIIESGPFSELKIEVLALEGSFPYGARGRWTSREFHEHIAYDRDGKGNVLAGKGTNAQLINGQCQLGSIRFKEGSCRARKRMFIVGARVCSSQAICDRVQEAVMNPVVVQDHRNKYNGKSHPPNPDEKVYRLERIAKNGEYHKRLKKENIRTVEHFSKALYKDKDNLARILQIKKNCRDWEKMVNHAQECCLQGKPELKSYPCEERNVVLFFNYVHCLVGARFGSRYIASDMFDPAQQNLVEKLKKNAYDQLDGLPEDHIMVDNTTDPICMHTDSGAGLSYMTSAIQQKNSGHHIAAHHVAGTPTSEVLSARAPPEPLRENANCDHGPNSIPDPNSTHNYQVGGIPAVEGLMHALNESAFAFVNDGPSSSFSVRDDPTTQTNQDQGTGLAGTAWNSNFFGGMCLNPMEDAQVFAGMAWNSNFPSFAAGAPELHQGEMQSLAGWSGIDTLEASASTRIYTVSPPQLLNSTGSPGSGQGSMQNQMHASLPNDGTMGSSSGSAQQSLPLHQWPQFQGNMPGNTSF